VCQIPQGFSDADRKGQWEEKRESSKEKKKKKKKKMSRFAGIAKLFLLLLLLLLLISGEIAEDARAETNAREL